LKKSDNGEKQFGSCTVYVTTHGDTRKKAATGTETSEKTLHEYIIAASQNVLKEKAGKSIEKS
jgi:hypothetical protein